MRSIIANEAGEPLRKRKRLDTDSSTQSTQRSTVTDQGSVSQLSHPSIQARNSFTALEPRSHPFGPELPITMSNNAPSSSHIPETAPARISPPKDEDLNGTQSTNSLDIPPLSLKAAKAKRNTIRQAWQHLHDAQNSQNRFQLGSLPSSWPTTEDDSQLSLAIPSAQNLRETSERSSQITAIDEPSNTRSTNTVRQEESSRQAVDEVDETEPNLNQDLDTVMESETEHETPLQLSHSSQNTISTSAFASQSQNQNQSPNQNELTGDYELESELDLQNEIIGDGEYISEHPQPEKNGYPPSLLRRESSIRSRRAAYAAAREGSYDAWASMALVSTGNNHTEEEVEL